MEKNYTIYYKGELRCEALHERSGSQLITDAPVDNKGKGEKFSPTDLVASALTTCILTIAGIHFNKKGKELTEIRCDVKKIMAANPRRIQEVIIHFDLMDNMLNEDDLHDLRHIVHNCPVTDSLSPDLKITTNLHVLNPL